MSKKQSLFKQKLKLDKLMTQSKENASTVSDEVQTFPKVFKVEKFQIKNSLDSHDVNKSLKQITTQEKLFADQAYDKSDSYLKKNQDTFHNVISPDQLSQIDQQNWSAVDSMKKQERENYINLIENTLPKNFIQKLKRNKNPQRLKPSISVEQTGMISQMSEKAFTEKRKTQIQSLQQNYPEDKEEDQGESHKHVMNQIYLNVRTQKLHYFAQNMLITLSEEDKKDLVNKTQIYQMLNSENNQSKIIGSQLTFMWFKNIFPSQNLVFLVDKIPFHTRIMLSEVYDLLLVIEVNMKQTTFYSCYIEMLVKSVQIVTLAYKQLSKDQLQGQIKFFHHQFQKSQKNLKAYLGKKRDSGGQKNQNLFTDENERLQKQMLFQSLKILNQCLGEEKTKKTEQSLQKHQLEAVFVEQRFQNLSKPFKMDDLIQAILIQQTLNKEQFEKYQIEPSINEFLRQLIDFWTLKLADLQALCQPNSNDNSEPMLKTMENQTDSKIYLKFKFLNQFYKPLYELVCKLNQKQRTFPFYKSVVKVIYTNLLVVFQEIYLKQVLEALFFKRFFGYSKQKQLQQAIVYKILFIYRQLCDKKQNLADFLQKKRQNWALTEQEACIIVYINFNHYLHVQDLNTKQIEMLEKMLSWLKRQIQFYHKKPQVNRLNVEEVLISLLSLFLSNDQEIYSLIDQNLLNEVFIQTIKLYESIYTSTKKNKNEGDRSLLSQVQIKKIVQNYNFNSFGNDIFTKVVFWISVNFSAQIEYLIAEEVMMRYPMLFYYASEPICSEKKPSSSQAKPSYQAKKPSSSQAKSSYQAKCPLLGKTSRYIKDKSDLKSKWFSGESNQGVKVNLLRLLNLNLDFSSSKGNQLQIIEKILSREQINSTRGFSIVKSRLNPQNYFYRYLSQPFVKPLQYEQLF